MNSKPGEAVERRSSVRLIPHACFALSDRLLARITPALRRTRISPNLASLAGLAAGLAAGGLFALGRALAAGLVVIACGLLDVLDGAIAIATGRQTRFGAILDSSLDRYSEFFLFAGLGFHFRGRWALGLAALAFLGAAMVSYTRARAEGLGLSGRAGIMQRAERLALLSLAAIIGSAFGAADAALIAALALIAVFSHATAWQRIFLARGPRNPIGGEP